MPTMESVTGMPSVSLVIPVYNEEKTILRTIDRCLATLHACGVEYEVLLLDDASTDATASLLQDIPKRDPGRIRLLSHPANKGIAATFEDLYKAASKDFVFLVPGDGEYPPEALLTILPLLREFDIVICRRTHKYYSVYRHIVSWSYRWCTRLLFGVDLFDPGSIKAVRRELFTIIPVRSTSVFVEAERLLRAVRRGYRLTSIDIRHEPRSGGRARGARWTTVSRAAKDIMHTRWDMLWHPESRITDLEQKTS